MRSIVFYFTMMLLMILGVLINSSDSHAADVVTPYFQVKLWTGYDKISKEFTKSPNSSQIVTNSTGKDEQEFTMGLPVTGSARMGLNGELNKVKGNVELGFSGTAVSLRHLYASYAFGPVDFLVGHTVTPYTNTSGNNVADDESGNWDVGTYDSRQPQARFTFLKMAYIAFIKPSQSVATTKDTTTYTANTTTGAVTSSTTTSVTDGIVSSTYEDQTLPKMAVGVMIPAGPAVISVHYVYQTTTISKENLTGASSTNTVKDNAYYLDGKKIVSSGIPFSVKAKFDPVSINLGGYVLGKNMGDMGMLSFSDLRAKTEGAGVSKKSKILNRWALKETCHSMLLSANLM